MPLLRDYIAEHERATNFGGEAVRAIDRGDLGHARHLLGEMATELASHWQGEETGLFRVRVTWNPMLQFENNESIDWAAVAANGGMCVVGPGHAYSISVNPCIDDDDRHSHPCVVR
jgi:hypothetical protein